MAGVAIVTGGNSGIGRATAVALAEAGFHVGFTWHDKEARAEEAAAELREKGARVALRQLDLERPADGPAVIDALVEELDGVDVLVNNAGTGASVPFLELDLETWRRVLDVDLTGAFLCAQAAARLMVDQGRGGRIVNVTSVHEHVPLPEAAAY